MGKSSLQAVVDEGKFYGFNGCNIGDVVADARPLAHLSEGGHKPVVQGKERNLCRYRRSVFSSCIFEVLSPLVIFAASFGALHLGFNPNAMSQICNILPGLDIYNLVSILGGSVAGAYIASPLAKLFANNEKKKFNNALEAVSDANDRTADFITKLSDASGIDFNNGFKLTYFNTNVRGEASQFPCGPQTECPVTSMDVLKIEEIVPAEGTSARAIYLYAVKGYFLQKGSLTESIEKGKVHAFRFDADSTGTSLNKNELQIIANETKMADLGEEILTCEVKAVDVAKLASQYTPEIHSVKEIGPRIVRAYNDRRAKRKR